MMRRKPMKKIKKIIVSIMLVFVLGTGMNITSTFNTVDVRAASVKLNKTNVNLTYCATSNRLCENL